MGRVEPTRAQASLNLYNASSPSRGFFFPSPSFLSFSIFFSRSRVHPLGFLRPESRPFLFFHLIVRVRRRLIPSLFLLVFLLENRFFFSPFSSSISLFSSRNTSLQLNGIKFIFEALERREESSSGKSSLKTWSKRSIHRPEI